LSATNSIYTYKYSQDFNINYYQNSIAIDYAIIVEGGELSEETTNEIKKYLQSKKGLASAGSIMYLPVSDPSIKVRLEKLDNLKARDGHFIEERKTAKEEIIVSHGITKDLLGINEKGGLATTQAMGALQLVNQTTIRPLKETFETFWNNFFVVEFGINPQFKLKEIDLTDNKQDAELEKIYSDIYARYSELGDITILNEFRKRIGLRELEESEFDNLINQDKVIEKFLDNK